MKIPLLDELARRVRTVPAARLREEAERVTDDARGRWYTRVRPGNDAVRSGESFEVRVRSGEVAIANLDPNARFIHARGTRVLLLDELVVEPARAGLRALAQSIAREIATGRR